jgi:hypothetical protein
MRTAFHFLRGLAIFLVASPYYLVVFVRTFRNVFRDLRAARVSVRDKGDGTHSGAE